MRPWFITTTRSESASASRLGMGHEDEGDAEIALGQAVELGLDGLAQVGVEGAERLVEEEDVGLDDEAARERDALALASGEAVSALMASSPRR